VLPYRLIIPYSVEEETYIFPFPETGIRIPAALLSENGKMAKGIYKV
jgi:hypothetical protein